ncbi:MAG TPA: hypothetical protein VOA87_15105 [Thermoanaerobaculia bacterium]|nr:hypothetical protein [Thermoanaerobaculia bacterium]
MSRRQTEGGETWSRLLRWDRGQAPSERLAAQVLRVEGYKAIDPSHPLGGQDGLKDIICVKDQIKTVGASYFPRGQQAFSMIRKKFAGDLEGVAKNVAARLAFITNQELNLGEREELRKMADTAQVDLFHLERIASILDSPWCYGIRLEFLDIEMTKEEQLAFMATVSQSSDRLEEMLAYINRSDILREELSKLKTAQGAPKMPHHVTPVLLAGHSLMSTFGGGDKLKKCSQCGYGYLIKGWGQFAMTAGIFSGQSVATCPKCGNVEYV